MLTNAPELYNLFSLLTEKGMSSFPHPLPEVPITLPSTQDQHTLGRIYILSNFPAPGCQLFYTLLKNCAILSKEVGGREGEKQGFCSLLRVWPPWRAGGSVTEQIISIVAATFTLGQQFPECGQRTPWGPQDLPFPPLYVCLRPNFN